MSRFCTLFSSSKGNSTYLSGGGTHLLVDAGSSCRRLLSALSQQEIAVEDISAILITHEHSDHISALSVLLKHHPIPVISAPETLDWLVRYNHLPADTCLIPIEESICIGDIEVTPFDTPHDAVHSLGYRFAMPDGRKIAVATDLGYVTTAVRRELTGCDLVLLEANYDPGMLSCSPYPYSVKRRVKSAIGHLSNDDSAEEILRLVQTGATRFVLGHLSEQNNLPQLAYQTVCATLQSLRLTAGTDFLLSVAPAHTPHEMAVF